MMNPRFPRRNKSKFFNKPVALDGYHFPSKAEAALYVSLRALQKSGEIRDLKIHPRFGFKINGVKVGYYEADFSYIDCKTQSLVVADKKSPITRKLAYYRLKRRIFEVIYAPLKITEF